MYLAEWIPYNEIIRLIGTEEEVFKNIEIEPADTISEIERLEAKFQDAVPLVKEVLSKRIERGEISNAVKKLYGYKCKVCEALGDNPHQFKKINGEYYIETHHIISVSKLTEGLLGISNLITVCPNHHRQFHYGDIKIIENTKDYLLINIEGKIVRTQKWSFTS